MDFAAVQSNDSYLTDQRFFTRLAQVLAGLIVFGFLQWALRGFVNPVRTPLYIHTHGLAMLGWLGTIVTQNRLAGSGNLALHRRLGWASLALVLAIVGLGSFAGRMALAAHRVPPFFTDSYFLALTHVEVAVFALTVGVAIAMRRQTQWHRRLMIAATVILMEPALGRLLPMPLLGQVGGGWLEAALQVGFLGIMARHDGKMLGRVHPATLLGMGLVVAVHALIQLLAGMPMVAAYAEAIARSAGGA
ncbi:adenylate cyclase [Novosphingobium sp.]|uniref:adenylate cyclase n=1 Tax=Novosphingobium sp. TaxID=1874826 RepID=UPI003BA84242